MAGIPTHYDGINFRSRAEAKWYALFKFLGWRAQYEPIDLDGYVPDFVLQWHRPLLVEVKGGAVTLAELAEHRAKIIASGWGHDAVLVGSCPIGPATDGNLIVGEISQRALHPDEWSWSPVRIVHCPNCEAPSLMTEEAGWTCYRCGAHAIAGRFLEAQRLWHHAGNVTQWKGIAC